MRLLSNTTFLIAVLATAAACGGKNPNPIDPPPPGLELSCPTAIVSEATTPQGTDVHFDAPVPKGGREPYNVQCDPGSSSMFGIGDTTVRCTVTDAEMARASCEFGVTVRVSRTIAKTKFMAFGDSITDGKVSLVPLISLTGPDTYPFQLQQMLRERYATLEIEVLPRGLSGERTDRGAQRLPGLLDADKPQVVLILEGVNAVWLLSTSRQADAIRSMIQSAKTRNVDAIVATVMPVSQAWEADGHVGSMSRIRALNERILQLASEPDGVTVVDLFAIFESNMNLIGADGLHPTVEGQTRIAEAFRDEIVRRYDGPPPTSLGFSAMRRAQ
jgi:lysophospholipase L1-like esterase